ncbi:hypothetical protein [Colwellia sp. RSH04]|uniref:hypothetical protein n=1 Tax=Colwellia sp. RSH04 TaxID=2305464 RepID=UPI000E58EC94|nr:hypothetical protein [Colwellia sp. RSH04]RHW76140.1 hypothetical protein D1094_10815 [Colwellia sp. RSH04]
MYKKIILLTSLLSFSSVSLATIHICPVIPKITDGCSLNLIGEEKGEVVETWAEILSSPYVGDFTESCNSHDSCYQTIGKTQQVCDHEFRENLYDECGLDPICKLEADIFVDTVQSYGKKYYNININNSASIVSQAEGNIASESCVTTPKHVNRYSSSMLNYVKNQFKSYVGRNPTTAEEFDLLNLYLLNENDSVNDYINWTNSVIPQIQNNYLNTSGPEAIYYKQSETYRGWTQAFIINAELSKGQSVQYKWHMVHDEEFDSDYRKSTPPAGGMMYINGYLKVENSDGKDYIVIDESFYVNSCTSTICYTEP